MVGKQGIFHCYTENCRKTFEGIVLDKYIDEEEYVYLIQTSELIDGVNKLLHIPCHFVFGFTEKLIGVSSSLMPRSLGLYTKNNELLYSDMHVNFKGKRYKIEDDIFRFRLVRSLVTDGENKSIVIDEDVAFECEII